MFFPSIGTPKSWLATTFLAISSAAFAGDNDDSPRFSTLSMSPAPVGGVARIDLRTSSPSSPFVLFIGTTVQSQDPDGFGPIPFLRTLGGGSIVVALSTDLTGRFAIQANVPSNPSLQGATLFSQALTLVPSGKLEATNVAATTFTPGASGSLFVDASSAVPAVAVQNSSGNGAAQDLDNDGDPDLAVITGPNGSVHLFRNDGNFTFTDVTSTAIPMSAMIEAANVELFDANNDGRVDILIIGGAGDPNDAPLPNLLLTNLGGFTFVLSPFPSVAGLPRDLAIVDLDRDGDLDIAIANGVDGVHANEVPAPNTILINQGGLQSGTTGLFANDAAFASAPWNNPDHNAAIAAGDIDNDGDIDLFFGRIDTQGTDGTPGQPNVLLRNDGFLGFTDISSNLQPLFSDNTQGARFGDFDGDGLLDLIVANTTVSILSANSGDYYRNQGNGLFVEDNAAFPQIDESEIALRNGVRLDDVDLDGDLDIIEYLHEFLDFDLSTGNATGGDDLLFLNQGGAQGGVHGTFLLDSTFSATGVFVSSDHVIADFDLDGDNDIYVCNSGGFFMPFPLNDRLLENKRIP